MILKMSERFSLPRKLRVALTKGEQDGGSDELSAARDTRLY